MDHPDATEAATILTVLSKLIPRKQGFTEDEAHGVLKVRRIVPDLDGWKTWLVAKLYMIAQDDEDRDALDSFLVYAPWCSSDRRDSYLHAVQRGLVPPVTAWGLLVGGEKPRDEWDLEPDEAEEENDDNVPPMPSVEGTG